MRFTFFFDQTKCKGCNTCSVSCKDWNQVNPGPVRWRKQVTYEKDGSFFPLSMACNHCKDPACLKACAAGAIKKREEDGVVVVDRDVCVGLRSCIQACPFAEPQYADDRQEAIKLNSWKVAHPMQKCDFCKELIDAGKQPICVSSCVTHALDFGDFEFLKRKYPDAVELSPATFPYAYPNNNNDTGPSILIRKRRPLTVTKAILKA